VIRPGLKPEPGQRRIAVVTRRRGDARLSQPLVVRTRPKGRRPVWGARLAAPQHHLYWPMSWQRSRAWVYGRLRTFRYKQLRCCWAVSGPQIPVHVYVVEMAGYREPWFLVTSALELSAAQVVEVWTARFRQEDGCRDQKQRLGLEACRAWTKAPMLRTFQVQRLALTLLRLLQARLDQAWGPGTCWRMPEWNPPKRHASILDRRRLFWRYRTECSRFLVTLEELEKCSRPLPLNRDLPEWAA
jgi:hypothetical protein